MPQSFQPALMLVLHLLAAQQLGKSIRDTLDEYRRNRPLVQVVCLALRIELQADPYESLRDACPDLPRQRPLWEVLALSPEPGFLGWYLDPLVGLMLVAEMQAWLRRQAQRGDGWTIWTASKLSKPEIIITLQKSLNLVRAGDIYKCLCPFHVERTASFVVWPKTQRWRCFGACATGGDVLDYLRLMKERSSD